MDVMIQNSANERLTITQAASLAACNRTYFYQKYITPWLIKTHIDERWKKYIRLSELLFATWPLPKPADNGQTNNKQQDRTTNWVSSDDIQTSVVAEVLQAKIDWLQTALQAKDEILRLKDQLLEQGEAREKFYQEELRAVRLLIAPITETVKPEVQKRKKWLWIF